MILLLSRLFQRFRLFLLILRENLSAAPGMNIADRALFASDSARKRTVVVLYAVVLLRDEFEGIVYLDLPPTCSGRD